MRFHPQLEVAFQAGRQAALARSDTGVAALSCCLWLTQLVSFALSRQTRTCAKVGGCKRLWWRAAVCRPVQPRQAECVAAAAAASATAATPAAQLPCPA